MSVGNKTLSNKGSEKNKVIGKILVKENYIGISGLIVTAYDLDSDVNEDSKMAVFNIEPGDEFWSKFKNANRLGSVITDQSGSFSIEYDDLDFRSNEGERRPDILIVVTAPEQQMTVPCPVILHYSCGLRLNAARLESYVVWIPKELLDKHGISVSDRSNELPIENTDLIVRKMQETFEKETKIDEGAKTVVKKRSVKKDEIKDDVKEKVRQLIEKISTKPSTDSNHLNAVFVEEGNIETATSKYVANIINNNINNLSLIKHVSVSEDQLPLLKDVNGNFRTDIPLEEVSDILSRPTNDQGGLILVPIDPVNLCSPQDFPYDHCSSPSGNNNGEGNNNTEPEIPFTKNDLPLFINRLIRNTTSPEKIISAGENSNLTGSVFTVNRAAESDVQNSINNFSLTHGPADSASIFEFHQLQVSFSHIWQELLDTDISNIATNIHIKLKQMGLNVDIYQNGGILADLDDEVDVIGEPDYQVVEFFAITKKEWLVLNESMKNRLREFAIKMAWISKFLSNGNVLEDGHTEENKEWLGLARFGTIKQEAGGSMVSFPYPISDILQIRDTYMTHLRQDLLQYKKRGESIIQYAHNLIKTEQDPFSQVNNLIGDLKKLLSENYKFTVYAADKTNCYVNYGLDIVYRQKWQPISYQVGKLIKTIPLAPKEIRKFSKKTVTKKSKSVEEVEKNVRSEKSETSDTNKTETEIVLNSQNKTNFNLTTKGNYDIKIASGTVTNAFTRDLSDSSNDVKKNYHEDVEKSSKDYQNTHEVKISTAESVEEEFQESGEITNPNDEIPVTYLFYELQRLCNVNEQIHKVVPIILVAQEVPKPNEINNDWIIKNDWILNRVLLDDSYRPALSYLSTKITGDEFALKVLEENMEQQRKLVEAIKEELVSVRAQVGSRYAALGKSIQDKIGAVTEGSGGVLNQVQETLFGFSAGNIVDKLFGDDKDDSAVEAAKMREEAARDAYERAERELKKVEDNLEREVTALNALTESYTNAASDHMNRKVMIYRLRLHIKENILYYMQAIWNHESPDQRFFRLHNVKVPKLKGKLKFATIEEDPSISPLYPYWNRTPLKVNVKCDFDPIDPTNPDHFEGLADVADLFNLLGYLGNCMIFPIKKSNALTEFMMEPYRDPHMNLRDPDESGNWSLAKFEEYVCCLKKNLEPQIFDTLIEGIEKKYESLLHSKPENEEIIIPSGSLYIEALPGKHPILEDFKLFHRAIDVKKVQAEVRKAELENIRLAARLITDEYEDADIEKKIVIEGNTSGTIVPPDDS